MFRVDRGVSVDWFLTEICVVDRAINLWCGSFRAISMLELNFPVESTQQRLRKHIRCKMITTHGILFIGPSERGGVSGVASAVPGIFVKWTSAGSRCLNADQRESVRSVYTVLMGILLVLTNVQ